MDGKLNTSTKIRSLAFGAALAVVAAWPAYAETIEVVDLQSPSSTVSFFSPETFNLSYDTTGWASIDSATLFLSLGDDGDFFLPEAAGTTAFGNDSVSLFLTPILSSRRPSTPTWYEVGSVLDLVALGGTTLTGSVFGLGDFLYGGASLVLEYTPVPEFSTSWMLAAGLLAVGGIGVKRRVLSRF